MIYTKQGAGEGGKTQCKCAWGVRLGGASVRAAVCVIALLT